jgi:hypothetical protein
MNVYTFGVFYLQGVWLSEFGAEIWNPCENRSYDGRNGCKPEGTDRVKVWGQVTGGRERVGSGSVEWSGSVVVVGRLGAGRRRGRRGGGVLRAGGASGMAAGCVGCMCSGQVRRENGRRRMRGAREWSCRQVRK